MQNAPPKVFDPSKTDHINRTTSWRHAYDLLFIFVTTIITITLLGGLSLLSPDTAWTSTAEW